MCCGATRNQMNVNGFGAEKFPSLGASMNTCHSLSVRMFSACGPGPGQPFPLSQMMSHFAGAMQMMMQMLLFQHMQAMSRSMASSDFGTQGSGLGSNTSGINGFLGGSSAGSSKGASTKGSSSAPVATSSDFGSVPGWGAGLAKDAEKNANGPGYYCFKWVSQALRRAGVKGIGGASAYMAADQLARNPKFREIKVNPKELSKLPAGAVVVWDRGGSGTSGAAKTHGHISISLGDGREASDKIRKQITGMGSNVRVFLPK